MFVRVDPGERSCGSAALTSTLPGLPVAEQKGFQVASCGPAEVRLGLVDWHLGGQGLLGLSLMCLSMSFSLFRYFKPRHWQLTAAEQALN